MRGNSFQSGSFTSNRVSLNTFPTLASRQKHKWEKRKRETLNSHLFWVPGAGTVVIRWLVDYKLGTVVHPSTQYSMARDSRLLSEAPTHYLVRSFVSGRGEKRDISESAVHLI